MVLIFCYSLLFIFVVKLELAATAWMNSIYQRKIHKTRKDEGGVGGVPATKKIFFLKQKGRHHPKRKALKTRFSRRFHFISNAIKIPLAKIEQSGAFKMIIAVRKTTSSSLQEFVCFFMRNPSKIKAYPGCVCLPQNEQNVRPSCKSVNMMPIQATKAATSHC